MFGKVFINPMKRVCGLGHGLLGYDLCGAANRFFNYAKTFVFTEVSVIGITKYLPKKIFVVDQA